MVNQHYYARYEKFINSLRNQVVEGYSEVHHIVPVSMGGSNDKDNLIALTARQHFVAHWILAKALSGSAARAFFMMSNFGKYGKVNSNTYEKARKEYSKLVSIQMRSRKPLAFTPEHREKLRQAKLGKKLTAEHRANVGKAQLGRKLSEETKRKISESKRAK
jgi:HNH endonuclease